MSYKTILVCPADGETTTQLTRAACQIADCSENSRVIGTHWIPKLQEFHHGQRIVGELQHDLDVPMMQRVRAMSSDFYKASYKGDFSTDWISIAATERHSSDVVVEYSRCCDLIIVPASGRGNRARELLSDLMLVSGKPTLVVPHDYGGKLDFDQVLIAWNCSRESARAAFDALPILIKARQTKILWIEESGSPNDIVHYRIKEFTTAMVLHNVKPVIQKIHTPERSNSSTSHLILSRAAQNGCGLIVAGAKNISTTDKNILGLTTTELIEATPIPILFSC